MVNKHIKILNFIHLQGIQINTSTPPTRIAKIERKRKKMLFSVSKSAKQAEFSYTEWKLMQ